MTAAVRGYGRSRRGGAWRAIRVVGRGGLESWEGVFGERGGQSCADVGRAVNMSGRASDARRMRLKKWGSLRSPNPVIADADTDHRGSGFQALRILSWVRGPRSALLHAQYCILIARHLSQTGWGWRDTYR